jgi:allantoate deiminase/N-carbamoyl-L-amino-acid hydrolase
LFLASSATAGRFDPEILDTRDAAGVRLGDLMRVCGLDAAGIPALARRAEDLLGYIEVHIEQGPVLLQRELPLGVVTAIAGGIRGTLTVSGTAGHAGTVPMALRHDAAAAAAEIVLAIERRCGGTPTLVGTVGRLVVPEGSTNVIPGRCELSLDIRAGDDPTWEAAVADVFAEIDAIAQRRGVTVETSKMLRKATVPCAPQLQNLLEQAISRAGFQPYAMPSGAGHDAMMFHGLTHVAMLFVRCGNGGISHSPLETITADDADIAARVMLDVLTNFPNH